MDHLRAGVGDLGVVGQRDRVKFADRIVALQDHARIFPRDRRTGLDLRPRDLRIHAAARTALCHEVINAALAVLVAGVPVLHGRIFDLGVVQSDELDDRRVKLIRIELRRRAAFVIGDVTAFFGDDQRSLELPRFLRVDAEIGRQAPSGSERLSG